MPRFLLSRHFPTVIRCDRGATAIEFAFLAPVFVLMLMAIIEFSLIMFTSAVMESATNNTARLGKTGYVAAGSTRTEQIIANIKARTSGLLDPNKITITTQVYSGFPQVGQPEPCITQSPCSGAAGVNFQDINGNGTWDADMGAVGQGNAGDVVVYVANYPWPIFTPVIRTLVGNTFTISSRTVVKNEPFNTGVTQ